METRMITSEGIRESFIEEDAFELGLKDEWAVKRQRRGDSVRSCPSYVGVVLSSHTSSDSFPVPAPSLTAQVSGTCPLLLVFPVTAQPEGSGLTNIYF